MNRIPSGAMIVMNAMSVCVRTASVTGCNCAVARPDSMASAVDGESASAVAMPMTCWRAAASPSFLASIGMLAEGKVVPVAGGVVIYQGDEVVGAVGISGASSDEDEECALAGIAAAGLATALLSPEAIGNLIATRKRPLC